MFFFFLFATDRLKSRRRGTSKDNLGLRRSEVCFTGMMLLECARLLLQFLGKEEAIWSKRKLKWLQVRGKSIQTKSHSASSQHLYPHWAIWPWLWAIFGYPRRKIKIVGEAWRYFRSWHQNFSPKDGCWDIACDKIQIVSEVWNHHLTVWMVENDRNVLWNTVMIRAALALNLAKN